MSQYFIESKQPTFFSFHQTIQNHETEIDYELLIKNFQDDFEKNQIENWFKFWNEQGEEQVLQTWNEKCKYYIKKDEDDAGTENKTGDREQSNTSILELHTQEENEADIIWHEKSWEDLWQEHREESYSAQFSIFATIYYNYFLDLKKSFESPQPVYEDPKDIEDENEETCKDLYSYNLKEELEKLSILGLPTSFTSRTHNSGKKHKNPKKSVINYSDFFSDSDMENASNESGTEENDQGSNVKNEDTLRNMEPKPKSKVQKRKRNRKLKNVPSFILEEKGLLKYWRKRFSLFSRFDEGIRLDRESWFSVTPEKVAKHLAERLKCSIIIDAFCGSGGNMIQFALTCDKVVAIDIDPVKLKMAKHNADIYKVSHKIEFILGDYLQLAAGGKLKADVVFLSPPWGGPKYKNKKEFDIEKYLVPVKASDLVQTSRNVSQNIALFLPRNSNVKQIVKLAGIGNRCEIEHNYLDSRLVAITALYGDEIVSKETTN